MHRSIRWSPLLLATVIAGMGCSRSEPPSDPVDWPTTPGWHSVGTLSRTALPSDLSFDGLQPTLWALYGAQLTPLGPSASAPLTLDRQAVEALVVTDPAGPRVVIRGADGVVWQGAPDATEQAAEGAASIAWMLPKSLYEAQDAAGRGVGVEGPESFAGRPSRRGPSRLRAEVREERVVLVHSEPNGSQRTVTPPDLPAASSVELLDVDAEDRAWLRLRRNAEQIALIDRHGRVIARDGLPPADRTFAVDSTGRLAVAERVAGHIEVRLYVPPVR